MPLMTRTVHYLLLSGKASSQTGWYMRITLLPILAVFLNCHMILVADAEKLYHGQPCGLVSVMPTPMCLHEQVLPRSGLPTSEKSFCSILRENETSLGRYYFLL